MEDGWGRVCWWGAQWSGKISLEVSSRLRRQPGTLKESVYQAEGRSFAKTLTGVWPDRQMERSARLEHGEQRGHQGG